MNYDFSNFPIDLILNILNIVILFVIVRFLVYKPVKKFMDARTARVTAAAEDAGAKAKALFFGRGIWYNSCKYRRDAQCSI